jgi:hypothetical protein
MFVFKIGLVHVYSKKYIDSLCLYLAHLRVDILFLNESGRRAADYTKKQMKSRLGKINRYNSGRESIYFLATQLGTKIEI